MSLLLSLQLQSRWKWKKSAERGKPMAEEKTSNAGKAAAVLGAGGLIAGALALIQGRKAQAASEGEIPSEIALDEAAMNLLLAMAQSAESIDTDLDSLLAAVNSIAGKLGITALENPPEIAAWTVYAPVVGTAIQLPDRRVPYDMNLVIKAIPTNLGLIYVGNSRADATNLNSSYWLIGNEAIEYKILNAKQLWISATRAGEGVICTVEQRKG
jgi:hypothetical protein